MNLLIDRGCNLNAKKKEGDGAVVLAIQNKQAEVLKVLKEKTDLLNNLGESDYKHLVLIAVMYNSLDCLKVLLSCRTIVFREMVGEIIKKNNYEMLSYVLLECSPSSADNISAEYLQGLLDDETTAKTEDIKKLLEVKIDVLKNPVVAVVVKKEEQEFDVKQEYIEGEEDTSILGGSTNNNNKKNITTTTTARHQKYLNTSVAAEIKSMIPPTTSSSSRVVIKQEPLQEDDATFKTSTNENTRLKEKVARLEKQLKETTDANTDLKNKLKEKQDENTRLKNEQHGNGTNRKNIVKSLQQEHQSLGKESGKRRQREE